MGLAGRSRSCASHVDNEYVNINGGGMGGLQEPGCQAPRAGHDTLEGCTSALPPAGH